MRNSGLIETTCSAPVVPGPSSFNVGSMDRYGNILPTINIAADQTLNWRAFDFADKYLSSLSTPSLVFQNALIALVDSMVQAGLWEYYHALYPLGTSNSTDNSLNLKYPYSTQEAMKLQFVGSPVHDANGLTFANLSQGIKLNMTPGVLEMYTSGHFSFYYRSYTPTNNNVDVSASGDSRNVTWFLNQPNAGSGTNGMSLCSNVSQINPAPALEYTGLWLLNRSNNTTLRQVRNGVLNRQISNSSFGPFYDGSSGSYSSIQMCNGPRNVAFISIGRGLTPVQELDMYNIIQVFQTSMGRAI